MVLSDTELLRAWQTGKLIIEPPPDDFIKPEQLLLGQNNGQVSTTAIDLHLSSELKTFKQPDDGIESIITLANYDREKFARSFLEKKIIHDEGFALSPNQLVLGITKEKIGFPRPACLCGRVEGRSSFARLGLVVHMTAPTIHAGFMGQIVLEIINLGKYPLKLTPNLKICQLIVENTYGTPSQQLKTTFQNQQQIST